MVALSQTGIARAAEPIGRIHVRMLPLYGGQAIDLPITKRIVELVTGFTRLIVAIMFSLSSNRPPGAVFALFASHLRLIRRLI